jgi:hypothetical protein
VSDLVYLVSKYGADNAFLKVRGQPVIFIYGRVMSQVPPSAWPEILRRAHAQAGDFLLVADGYSDRNAKLFDGLHTYNICGQVKKAMQLVPDGIRTWAAAYYEEVVDRARHYGRISCVDVIPGYDDTKIRHPGLNVDRMDGQLYRILWEEAIRAKPDWILITSWNEWHEGSEIEPSYELGDKYLKITDLYATAFTHAFTHTNVPTISGLQAEIQVQFEELEVLEHEKERNFKQIDALPLPPGEAWNQANKAKDAIYTDQEYLQALEAFERAMTNHLSAVYAELTVYHNIATADFLGDFHKTASTNVNQTSVPPAPTASH